MKIGGLTSARKKLLLGAAIVTLAFLYLPASLEAMLASSLGQYVGQYLGVIVSFGVAVGTLWFIRKAEKHV